MSESTPGGTGKVEPFSEFDMEPFGSGSLKKEENDQTNFVSIQKGPGTAEDFVFYGNQEDDQRKQSQADDMLRNAKEKVALLEKEAYEKGFTQGEKDGLELGEKKATKIIENIEGLFEEFCNIKKILVRENEKEILELTFAIAKKIIHHQLQIDEELVKETAISIIRSAAERSNVVLKVNPEDFDYVEKLRPDLFSKFDDLKSIVVTSDPSIMRGGCFLETPSGDVDARIETQLEEIHKSLEKTFMERSDD